MMAADMIFGEYVIKWDYLFGDEQSLFWNKPKNISTIILVAPSPESLLVHQPSKRKGIDGNPKLLAQLRWKHVSSF